MRVSKKWFFRSWLLTFVKKSMGAFDSKISLFRVLKSIIAKPATFLASQLLHENVYKKEKNSHLSGSFYLVLFGIYSVLCLWQNVEARKEEIRRI